jgi:membrane protein DedA with SNARE-associated domain
LSGLIDQLTGLPAGWVYLIVALLVFAEDAVLVGFLLPGETAAILGGVTASTGHTHVAAMILIVVAAAILGDSVGYEIGARYGIHLLRLPYLARRRERIDRARAYLARRGGPAVFLGRSVAFLRAMMPFLSGLAHMRYRIFLAYNAAGGLVWGVAVVLLGFFAGLSYQRVAHRFGEAAAITVTVIAVAALVVWRVRRERDSSDESGNS